MILTGDPVPDLLRPGAHEDPSWTGRVRGLSPSDRTRVLLSADALLAAKGDGARTAVAAYAALVEGLDPAANPGDLERMRAAFETRWSDARCEALYRRAIARAPDPDVVLKASVLLAQVLLLRGDYPEAERLYRTAMRGKHASLAFFVRGALYGLTQWFANTDREVETLLLARTAARRMAAAGDPWGGCLCDLRVSAALRILGDLDRAEEALREAEAKTTALDEAYRTRIRSSFPHHRALIASARGAAQDTLRLLDEADAADAGRRDASPDPGRDGLVRIDALLRVGRRGEAIEMLERLVSTRARRDATFWRLEEARIAWALARRDEVQALRCADAIVEALAGEDGAGMGPGASGSIARRLARDLSGVPIAATVVEKAWDVAAVAGLERMREIDRFTREWPEVEAPGSLDLESLAAARRRSLAEQTPMHEATARRLADADLEGRVLLPFFPAGGALVCVCAWCQRARTSDGIWLCVQQFLPIQVDGPLRLTHGICEDCRPRLAAELEESVPAAKAS